MKDRIRKECIRYIGIALIGDRSRETRLRWFGHVQHIANNDDDEERH